MDYKNQPPDPYPRRRGRTPKPTDHPIGRLIRERRLALGLSLAALAEKVGIGPTSVSLIAAMEHGTLPPRRDVAEKLADVLGLDRHLLIEWSSMRVSPHLPSEVLERRERYDAALRDAWDSDIEPISFAARTVRPRILCLDCAMLSKRSDSSAAVGISRMEAPPPPRDADFSKITVYPAGVDPDRFRGEPAGLCRPGAGRDTGAGESRTDPPHRLPGAPEDLDRLRRSSFPSTPPTYAVISRPLPVVIDSREPYAIRFERTVILAYCAWDGRELVVLDPPGHQGFARLKARNARRARGDRRRSGCGPQLVSDRVSR